MRLAEIRDAISEYAEGFDASALTGTEALLGIRAAARIENIAAALKAQCSARVAETELHRGLGARSAAELLAKESGTTIGAAKDAIESAQRLADQPALNDAVLRGRVSAQQTAVISDAAAADPSAEATLLDQVAAGASLPELREQAARIKAAAHPDPEARRRKIHAERYLRSFTDGEGAGNLRMRDNPEVVAQVMARIDELTDDIFRAAYRDGRRERREAYAADAMLQLASGSSNGTGAPAKAKVIFRVDWPAWLRGYPTDGEVMELVGFGPVAASTIGDALAAGGFVAAVITKGARLTGVAHLGRAPTAKQQSALEWLYPTCAAMGCAQVARLQRDHRIDWADTRVTMLDWLDLLCAHHHDLKTRKNWQLVAGTGKRAFVDSDDPRHPGNAHAPPGDQ
ncbi:MAG TPA: DUF222 domain-containing protein [Acidimicrobiales bacterium]|nr:DUF222 domain-containing protein [Acidimicrobiales bacterium]